jgi:excinuclease ABC subunit A
VTGVSGSGKSTLINETLYRALREKLGLKEQEKVGAYKEMSGLENLDKVIFIDQAPIGKTPRSNPATYTKAFDGIRQVFALTSEAKLRGYKEGRFSFNVPGGRCEACQGEGEIRIEMQFLPDVYVPCELCHGTRYNSETLEVTYKGKNIAEVLSLTVEEALSFFSHIPLISEKLQTLVEVGLGYLRLGQSAPTLSGGESQRVKLSRELAKRATGKTVYLLDEPTTGLHFADLEKLLSVLQRLVKKGNTVIVIGHNLEVIRQADFVIDLGPEGGQEGGRVVFAGSPKELAQQKASSTGAALRQANL